MWHVSDRSQPSSTNDEHNNVKSHTILPHQKTSKLRFVSSVAFRHSSGKSLLPPLFQISLAAARQIPSLPMFIFKFAVFHLLTVSVSELEDPLQAQYAKSMKE